MYVHFHSGVRSARLLVRTQQCEYIVEVRILSSSLLFSRRKILKYFDKSKLKCIYVCVHSASIFMVVYPVVVEFTRARWTNSLTPVFFNLIFCAIMALMQVPYDADFCFLIFQGPDSMLYLYPTS